MDLKKKRLISGIVGGVVIAIAIFAAIWWAVKGVIDSLGFNPFAS